MDIIHYDSISAYNASIGLETEHPLVAEVAYSLGFEYPQHFTRYFKRMTALSPSQWRQQHEIIRRE